MKNLITKILLAGLVLIGSTSMAAAQQAITPEKRALIKELLEATGEPKSSEDIFNAIMKQYETEVPKLTNELIKSNEQLSKDTKDKLLADMNKEIPQIIRRYTKMFAERINIPKFVEDTVYPLYDKYFTENEIRDLITFYRTETGKKTIAVMPALSAESISKSFEYLMPVMKQIQEEMRRDIEQLVKGKLSDTNRRPGKS